MFALTHSLSVRTCLGVLRSNLACANKKPYLRSWDRIPVSSWTPDRWSVYCVVPIIICNRCSTKHALPRGAHGQHVSLRTYDSSSFCLNMFGWVRKFDQESNDNWQLHVTRIRLIWKMKINFENWTYMEFEEESKLENVWSCDKNLVTIIYGWPSLDSDMI